MFKICYTFFKKSKQKQITHQKTEKKEEEKGGLILNTKPVTLFICKYSN